MTLFGVDKRVVSKRVVSADVPPERKPERGYVRQNHPFTKLLFYLPVSFQWVECKVVIFAVFVKTALFWQGTETWFTKNTVCATPNLQI